MYSSLLIAGGAGFVGSNLAIAFKKKYPRLNVIALDNLKRRGSELNINRLKDQGVVFVQGDIRNKEDLEFTDQKISLILECSAEPSVLAGFGSSPQYLLNSNLVGALNCLEIARLHRSDFVFLSTSRVYPTQKINSLNYIEEDTRFSLADTQPFSGASSRGISETFPLDAPRSLYGATKLSAELIIQEYADMYGIRAIINRCGVIAGPWQMGKVDQGVFTLWMAAHYFKKPLSYIGFGGQGKQVRDVLHIDDLFELLDFQINHIEQFNGFVYNVGGGLSNSLSLLETTVLCKTITGNYIDIKKEPENRPADIKYYVSDNTRIEKAASWQPVRSSEKTLSDIWYWIKENEHQLKPILE